MAISPSSIGLPRACRRSLVQPPGGFLNRRPGRSLVLVGFLNRRPLRSLDRRPGRSLDRRPGRSLDG